MGNCFRLVTGVITVEMCTDCRVKSWTCQIHFKYRLTSKPIQRESHESMQDGRWTEWILQCPSAVEAKLADFGLALYVGRKFFSVPCWGKRMATGQGGIDTLCDFLVWSWRDSTNPQFNIFWKLLQGVAYSSVWYGCNYIKIHSRVGDSTEIHFLQKSSFELIPRIKETAKSRAIWEWECSHCRTHFEIIQRISLRPSAKL